MFAVNGLRLVSQSNGCSAIGANCIPCRILSATLLAIFLSDFKTADVEPLFCISEPNTLQSTSGK